MHLSSFPKCAIHVPVFKKYCADTDESLTPEHHCAKNWKLSSTAMEPKGIVSCAISILDTGRAWLWTFVSNDDSSIHDALKYSVEARKQIDNTDDWPLDVDNKKITDRYRKITCLGC